MALRYGDGRWRRPRRDGVQVQSEARAYVHLDEGRTPPIVVVDVTHVSLFNDSTDVIVSERR